MTFFNQLTQITSLTHHTARKALENHSDTPTLDKHRYNRFLPYEFVESALKYCVENKTSLPTADEMSIEDIFSFFEAKGVSYVGVFGSYFLNTLDNYSDTPTHRYDKI